MEDVSNQGRMIDELDKDEGVVLMNEKEETKEVKDITGDAQVEGRQAEIYQIDMDHAAKVLSIQEDEPEIQEAVEVVTTAKLITKVVAAVSETVSAADVVPSVTAAATVTLASVKHLEIVPGEDDDVYTEATPLARKVPVVDYQIIQLNNEPHFKIIRADETHQLYVNFITLLKNFDREDLESPWSIVKERFSTLKPNNFSDDFLLITLRAMFGRPYRQEQVWMNQRSVHGQAKIPTLEVYIGSDPEYSTAKSRRADEELSAARHKLMPLDTAAKKNDAAKSS
nr:hypothetical protein [Tanacetum cinerariifolium]